MTSLELKKIKVELLNVSAAKAGLELRIEEYLDNIKRLEENISIQRTKEDELKARISAEEASK
jgi:hypothetical protein